MRSTLTMLVFLALAASGATADTILVDLNGGGDHLTIQAGVDAASEGDTVLVAPGAYSGAGNYNINFGGTNLVLMSVAGAESTVIDMPYSPSDVALQLSSGEDTTSVFQGFTCRIEPGYFGGLIYLAGSASSRVGLTVKDCVLSLRGIWVSFGTVVVRRTHFDHCMTEAYYGGGMSCWHSTVIVEDSLFDRCHIGSMLGGWGLGMSLSYCDAAVTRTRFQDCYGQRYARGVLYAEHSAVSLNHVTFLNDGTYQLMACQGSTIDAGNLTVASGSCAIRTETSATASVENSIIAFNDTPFTVVAGTAITHSCIFGNSVGDSLSCAHANNMFVDPLFCDLEQGAVWLRGDSPCLPANNPWSLLVGDVPYVCAPREILVTPDGTGDFPTIQAAIDSADVWDEVVLADGVYGGDGNRDLDYRGKGITVRSEHGDPALCVIECGGAEAEPHRGVSFVTGEGGYTVLSGVTITGGHATRGGGIYCSDASPMVEDCIIRDNRALVGGGLYAGAGWPPVTLRGCAFVSNAADTGGAAAAMKTWDGYPATVFDRCTIAGNTAPVGAGLATCAYSLIRDVAANTVIAFNGPGEGVWAQSHPSHPYWSVRIAYTDIFGNEGGDWVGELADIEHQYGNMSADPLFCAGGFSLLEDCSPCIGAASDGGNLGTGEVGCPCGDPTGVDVEPAALQLVSVSNPARETCRFSFYRAGPPVDVTVTIYNIEGRKVAELVLPAQRSGLGSVRWNCMDRSGIRVASGVYPYQISDGASSARGLVTIVR